MQISPHDALIVVDVQNDFCPGGALAVADGDRIVPIINGLMPHFSHIILTQDWHPADHVSFADNHQLPAFSQVSLDYGQQVLWPSHCRQGSTGIDRGGLSPRPGHHHRPADYP